MRRSKSDPAKYARNYRKISQRRMTQYDGLDEEKEIQRLRSILRSSEKHLKQVDDSSELPADGEKKKRKRLIKKEDDIAEDHDTSIFSKEFLEEQGHGKFGCENNSFIIKPKKKKKDKKNIVHLSAEEIKEARSIQKKTARKLQQLEARAAQKKKRAKLYKKLQEDQASQAALHSLLLSSGNLSRKNSDTKRQAVRKVFNKEKAGLSLTREEQDLLSPSCTVEYNLSSAHSNNASVILKHSPKENSSKRSKKECKVKGNPSQSKEGKFIEKIAIKDIEDGVEDTSDSKETSCDKAKKIESVKSQSLAAMDFAAQMMASISKLNDTNKEKAQTPKSERNEIKTNNLPQQKQRYTPSNPTILKTAAMIGLESSCQSNLNTEVIQIRRPPDVEKNRRDLPVTAMEFEIMDAIRNNDVTIVCGETGSGKSTQIPTYVYEGGMCNSRGDPSKVFLVGVTQPRRVAAVSTAKRICYELGQGDGQSIKGSGGKGNLVAYKTRFESAGCGDSTRIQFMTDGILLSEIQSDLLLRRYSVIILDESHERNLNTDVLIGLLSVALPLRKKAALEDPTIPPLKLVLMSATLRIEDFTRNEKLFPNGSPKVVTVPGRTYPVTIHHSKVTELDDYENIAFQKICKIHRKLPSGGILVFLTGKAEIIRMVNRLRRYLGNVGNHEEFEGSRDVQMLLSQTDTTNFPRELDDEELDDENENVDVDEIDIIDGDLGDNINIAPNSSDDNIPKEVCVLPLYSLLSAEDQAKVFAPIPQSHRLIVVATNIAETSVTIPGITYVVDTGRQKFRNSNSGTGVASYDIMWISKASAGQRAGRAGRTGPGHCYRLYSSSLYSRHMDDFALPEVLTRPLEDIVLAMKAMEISNVSCFPFPTPPDTSRVAAAVKLLANIGCVDTSNVERDGGDGVITRLGKAVSKLPLGVRYSKMLLVAAKAGVLDYAIVIVAILSEASLFSSHDSKISNKQGGEEKDDSDLDEIDTKLVEERKKKKRNSNQWFNHGGDVLAAVLAVGAYTYAGRGLGGASEKFAKSKFCEENGLNYVIMCRIQKMRSHLATIARNRLGSTTGVAARTGGFSSKMSPPNKIEEMLLTQSIASGLLDHVALLATPGSISGDYPIDLRSAYISSASSINSPLFLDKGSVLYTRDYRQLPRWVCYDSIVRKTARDGSPINVMKNITPIDPTWLGEISKGTRMLSLGAALSLPPPIYDVEQDQILCSVTTKYGARGWQICPTKLGMYEALNSINRKENHSFLRDDSFCWFARFLWEGKIISEFAELKNLMNDSPSLLTQKIPSQKVNILVSELSRTGIDNASALRKHWSEKDDKFLFLQLKNWIKRECRSQAKKIWVEGVRQNVQKWRAISCQK